MSKDKIYYCACTKTECEGICRRLHLHRKVGKINLCPAAYYVDDEGKEIYFKKESIRGTRGGRKKKNKADNEPAESNGI